MTSTEIPPAKNTAAIFVLFIAFFVMNDALAQDPPTWSTGADMPTPRKEIANATVALNDEVYILGGVDQQGNVSNVVDVYNPATNSWRSAAPLPLAVWRSSAAVVNGRIYIFGGFQFQVQRAFPFNPTNRVFEYDPEANTWVEKARMNTLRGALSAVTLGGEVHVIGGANIAALATHEVYDPVTNQWRTAAGLIETRSGLTAAALDGKIYAFGGYRLGAGNVFRRTTAEVYDPATDGWSFITDPPQARLGIDAVVVNDRIIVIGGNDTAPPRTVQYDPQTDTWNGLADMPTPVNFMGVARVGHVVVAAGGGPVNLDRFDAVADTRLLTFSAPFLINAGLNDAWFNPLTDGQGFFITVFPELGVITLAWFTYDTSLPDAGASAKLGDAGHRWLTALGSIDGNRSVMAITITSGGLFDTATAVERVDDGTIIITFNNCNSGTIVYNIPSIGRQGSIPIERVVSDNIDLCEALSGE